MTPTSVYTKVGGLRLHHLDWGGPGPVVVCLHGLTRSAHDFDALARRLSSRFGVLALDARGRGGSDAAPPETYHTGQYARDLEGWLDALGLGRVRLVGTSMGGLTSIAFGAGHPARVAALVLNDIGPAIETAGLVRIQRYVAGAPEVFPDLASVARWQAETNPNPRMSEADYLEWARWQTRPLAGGGFGWHYDRAIREQMRGAQVLRARSEAVRPSEAPTAPPLPDLWAACEALPGPTLIVRGGASDVLSAATVAEMCARMKGCSSLEVPDVGHAPTLVEPEVAPVLERFLRAA